MPCDIDSFRDELVKPFGARADTAVVAWRRTCWFGKQGATWPERLGYELGRGVVNVCETVDLSHAPGAAMLDGQPALSVLGPQTLLVRLAQSHRLSELPMRDVDNAIAAELVYSVWARRRDPSCWNRGYAEGVPAFFDHHIAFGAEPENVNLDTFCRSGPDGGYPGNWRVEAFPEGYVPTARGERGYEYARSGFKLAIHRVSSLEGFLSAIETAKAWILGISDLSIRQAVDSTGAPPSVSELLIHSRTEIDAGVARLLAIALPAG